MASHDAELLEAARQLLTRTEGQRGKLPSARVRRSISTAYYALFHFLLDEAALKIVGAGNGLRIRRRLFIRAITHSGMRLAIDKIQGQAINESLAPFFGSTEIAPRFARNLAKAFADAHGKRQSADYDLNEPLTESDARRLVARVQRVIEEWREAQSPEDRDFKHALAIVILLKGKLRQEF